MRKRTDYRTATARADSPPATGSAAMMWQLRKDLGLPQREFAAALMLTREALNTYETGRVEWRPVYLVNAKTMLRAYLEKRHAAHMAALDKCDPQTKAVSESARQEKES